MRRAEEFEAQCRLDRLKQQRMQAEFAAHYIKHAKDRMNSLQSEHMQEKKEAQDHAFHSDEAFNRNEREYIDRINGKIERQG